MSKGSKPRPVNKPRYDQNWDKIFKPKKKKTKESKK
jgi:hypothetical protein